jgi:hypothetical protein
LRCVFAGEGVDGDFDWKNPRIDLWFFIFWVLEVDFFRADAAAGVDAFGGDDAAPFLGGIVSWGAFSI